MSCLVITSCVITQVASFPQTGYLATCTSDLPLWAAPFGRRPDAPLHKLREGLPGAAGLHLPGAGTYGCEAAAPHADPPRPDRIHSLREVPLRPHCGKVQAIVHAGFVMLLQALASPTSLGLMHHVCCVWWGGGGGGGGGG